MKNLISVITILVIALNSAHAQGTLEATANTTEKSQQEIMDNFNSKTNISVKVYPNPASNFLMVEPEIHTEAGFMKIMDVAGNLKTSMHLETGTNGVSIDLSQYIPGLYVLAYYDENGKLLHVNRFYKN